MDKPLPAAAAGRGSVSRRASLPSLAACVIARRKCLQLGWDRDGELLAVLQEGSAIIKLWDANQHSESSLDTNMKDLSFIKWAVAGPQLAIGTAKGNRDHSLRSNPTIVVCGS